MSNSTCKKKRMLMQEVVQSDPLRFFGGAITPPGFSVLPEKRTLMLQRTGRKTAKLMMGCSVLVTQNKTMYKVGDSTIVVGCRKGRSNLSVMGKQKKKRKNPLHLGKEFDVDESSLLRSRPWGQG
uniref:Uncharacterized protein n=1 Tax=Salix viminalis TaxID=40686 RepID=A0A6N2LNF4_SALVM